MMRAVPLVIGLAAVALGLWGVVRQVLEQIMAGAPVRSDELVVGATAAVALGLTAWLATGVVVVALASLPGAMGSGAAALADALAPQALRRVVGVVLGLTVAAGVAPGASVAAPRPPSVTVVLDRPDPGFTPLPDPGWTIGAAPSGVGGGPDDGLPSARPAPDPGWVPAPPLVRPQPDLRVLAPSRHRESPEDASEVVVRRGDTLWSIAARHLGPNPSEAEVASAWPDWFAANRDVVGDDPDLLRPGQVLRAPEAAS